MGGRTWRLAAALLASGLLVLSGVLAAVRVGQPADGTATSASTPLPDGVEIAVLVPGTALHSGDEVIGVDGRPLAIRSLPDTEPGDELTYRVRRGGRVLDVEVTIRRYPVAAALARNWPALALVGSVLVVAAFVFARRPEDPGAQALLLCAAFLACGSTASLFGLQVLDLGGGPGWWANLLGGAAYLYVWPAMLHFALVLGGPRPLIRRAPWLLAVVYLAPAAAYALGIALDRPDATTPLQRAGTLVPRSSLAEWVFPALILAAFCCAYRTGDKGTRCRLRWVAGSFAIATALYLALWKVPLLLTGEPLVPQPLHLLVFLPVPVAIGVAVLRLQLFDIDVAVRRSLVYATLTACTVGIYVATVALFSGIVPRSGSWAGLIATGVVAVLFSPLHRRLQAVVSRLLYGERDDPYAVVARLGERLASTPAPDQLLPSLVATVAEALRLPYAAVELTGRPGNDEAARYGELAGASLVLPLTYQGEVIGHLVVGERTPGDGFGKRDRRVLTGLAAQIGMAVYSARLTLDLQRSRERLVGAREEERRRIRRDLHDGLGPVLAITALRLEAARRVVRSDPDAATAILDDLTTHARSAIGDVRRLVDDLRPASLDSLGLVAAIEEQASRFGSDNGGFRVEVEAAGDLRSLPAAAEVAAFRIACEALTNAHRHAHASTCRVRLVRNGALEVEVVDDGRGLVAGGRPGGVGLESMRERALELGGSFAVASEPEGGTRVWARLPLPA